MRWDALLLPWLAVAGAGGIALLAALLVNLRDRRIDTRLGDLAERGGRPGSKRSASASTHRLPEIVQAAIPKLGAQLLPGDEAKRLRLQHRIIHAGIYAPSAVFILLGMRLFLTLLGLLLGVGSVMTRLVEMRVGLWLGLLAAGSGFLLPSLWLDWRKSRRQDEFARSLPDFLDLMVTCVGGGLSVEGALQRVTDEFLVVHPTLAGELNLVQREMQLGQPVDVALRSFAERCDMEAVRTLSTFVHHAKRFGTSVADAMRIHADTLRLQREERAEERAQKAAVKILFPTLLFIFPAIFVVLAGPAAIQLRERFVAPSVGGS
ncbi:MAG: type II secretion system F family protein [Planctomycetes bacterium]|nr:type II secretion system F family protein [Planctomycetota bacterium]